MVKEQQKFLSSKVPCKYYYLYKKRIPILNEFQLENSFKIGILFGLKNKRFSGRFLCLFDP
jgi:hypothetical protein